MRIQSERYLTNGQMAWLISFHHSRGNRVNGQSIIEDVELIPQGENRYIATIEINDDPNILNKINDTNLLKILLVALILVVSTSQDAVGFNRELETLQNIAMKIKSPKAIQIIISGVLSLLCARTKVSLFRSMRTSKHELEISTNSKEITEQESECGLDILWKFKVELHLSKF